MDGPGSPWPYTELIEDPAAADALIDRLVADGWRWIKVYPHLRRDVYEAVLAASARNGIRVIGHVPFSIPIEDAMREGHWSVEHLLGYERSLVAESNGFYLDWAAADAASMPQLAELTASLGVWNCPTLAIIHIYANSVEGDGTGSGEPAQDGGRAPPGRRTSARGDGLGHRRDAARLFPS